MDLRVNSCIPQNRAFRGYLKSGVKNGIKNSKNRQIVQDFMNNVHPEIGLCESGKNDGCAKFILTCGNHYVDTIPAGRISHIAHRISTGKLTPHNLQIEFLSRMLKKPEIIDARHPAKFRTKQEGLDTINGYVETIIGKGRDGFFNDLFLTLRSVQSKL